MALRKEAVESVFFRGVFGEEDGYVNPSPKADEHFGKVLSEWADDFSGLTGSEQRIVSIVSGEKDGLKGHFVKKTIVSFPDQT